MAGGRIRSVKFLLADMMLDSPHCTGSRLGGGGEEAASSVTQESMGVQVTVEVSRRDPQRSGRPGAQAQADSSIAQKSAVRHEHMCSLSSTDSSLQFGLPMPSPPPAGISEQHMPGHVRGADSRQPSLPRLICSDGGIMLGEDRPEDQPSSDWGGKLDLKDWHADSDLEGTPAHNRWVQTGRKAFTRTSDLVPGERFATCAHRKKRNQGASDQYN
ncbi:hypothetical protein WJX77_000931 [Trebouxia sp. C0004]